MTAAFKLAMSRFDTDHAALVRYSYACERYYDQLNGEAESNSDQAEAMRITLESIDPDFDVAESGMITLRALKTALTEAVKWAKEMLRYVFEAFNALFIKFTGSIGKVRNIHQTLSKRYGTLGNRVTTNKMKVAGTQRLSINGEFVGDQVENLRDIDQLSRYILEQYPRSVVSIARDTSRKFLNIVEKGKGRDPAELTQEASHEFASIMRTSFVRPYGHTEANARETGEEGMQRSAILPGNWALVFTPPETIIQRAEANVDSVNTMRQALIMTFTELQMSVADRSEREIAVPGMQTIGQLLDAISGILTVAEKSRQVETNFDSVQHVVDDAIRQISERSLSSGAPSNGMIHMLGEISKKLAEPAGQYLHWLAVTLNVYLTFISQCLTHYENEGH